MPVKYIADYWRADSPYKVFSKEFDTKDEAEKYLACISPKYIRRIYHIKISYAKQPEGKPSPRRPYKPRFISPPPGTISIKEAQDLTSLSNAIITGWITKGYVKSEKIKGKWVVDSNDLLMVFETLKPKLFAKMTAPASQVNEEIVQYYKSFLNGDRCL